MNNQNLVVIFKAHVGGVDYNEFSLDGLRNRLKEGQRPILKTHVEEIIGNY